MWVFLLVVLVLALVFPPSSFNMVDVPTTRNMEDFFINPTRDMGDRYTAETPRMSRMTSRHALTIRKSMELLASKSGRTTSSRSRERESYADPLSDILRGYTSDEEAASSPDDSDALSTASNSDAEIMDATPTRMSIIVPEDLVTSYIARERQFLRARAMSLKPIATGPGGPGLLSPRLIDIPASPVTQRQSPVRQRRPHVAQLQKSQALRNDKSVSSTPRSSMDDRSDTSAPSTPPTSIDERSPFSDKVIRRKRSTPVMRDIACAQGSYSPSASSTDLDLREFLASVPATVPTQNRHTVAAPPPRRRLQKFSSSFSLSRLANTKRRDSTDSSADEEFPPATSLRPVPEVYIPTRTSSMQPKLVPRGANERAQPLVLPPFLNEYGEELDYRRPLTGHGKASLTVYSPSGTPGQSRKLHKRQRSISADAVASYVR